VVSIRATTQVSSAAKVLWRMPRGLARADRNRAAVRFSATDAEQAAENQEHLVLVLMRVPGELSVRLRDLDVLIVDLANHSRRPKLVKSGTCKFERDRVLLGLLGRLLFEF